MNILITGANRGLGLQKVKYILKSIPDSNIYVTARSQGLYQEAMEGLKQQNYDTKLIHFLQADFSSDSSILQLINNIRALDIKLDVVVNNAGVFSWKKDHDFANIVQVDFLGLFLFTESVLNENLIAEGGKIISLSTVHANIKDVKDHQNLRAIIDAQKDELPKIAKHLIENYSLYSGGDEDGKFQMSYKVSKLLVNKYTQLLGEDPRVLQKNIQVNAIHPGWVKTDMGTSGGKLELEEGTKAFSFILGLPRTIDTEYQGKLVNYKQQVVDTFDETINFDDYF